MVVSGAAFAYHRYSDAYAAHETAARRAGVGVWSGTAQQPEAFRRGKAKPLADAAEAGCAIKGNISDGGRIYHMPGQRDYAKVTIRPANGERWFCTEAEERAAGWRPAAR